MSSVLGAIFGATSPVESSEGKRTLADTSIGEGDANSSKRPTLDLSTDAKSEEQSLVKSMEGMFMTIQSQLETLGSQNKNVLSKLDDINIRMSAMEESSSSQQIVIDNLQERVRELETQNESLKEKLSNIAVNRPPNW